MKTVMLIIFCTILVFDFLMLTPLGVLWTIKDIDEGNVCYGALIMFATAIPMMLIGCYLGIIK